jgi:hypothetical protein
MTPEQRGFLGLILKVLKLLPPRGRAWHRRGNGIRTEIGRISQGTGKAMAVPPGAPGHFSFHVSGQSKLDGVDKFLDLSFPRKADIYIPLFNLYSGMKLVIGSNSV